MEMKKLPIGIQYFPEIIENGYAYVDKTGFIPMLLQGKYYFLSRPRRFGKSLFLSTLHAFFSGRRELFKDLAVDRADVDWTPHPVLHFDFNSGAFDDEGALLEIIDETLSKYEIEYGVERGEKSRAAVPVRFGSLLEHIFDMTGRKVVVLVDEYDKPLLGAEEDRTLFLKNQLLLKGFYGNLKSKDGYIRFAFLSGVARFNKVSIFSDVNNLNDISLHDRYADICGWTEGELLSIFRDGIEHLAESRNEGFREFLSRMRNYYDGYLFAPGGERLYNPFSVLKALDAGKLGTYWFQTGTPTFLARRVKRYGIDPASLNGKVVREAHLLEVGLDTGDPAPLMFQTGYLTIGNYDERRDRYELRFPNYEVEHGFADSLFRIYVPEPVRKKGIFAAEEFEDDLLDGRPEAFLKRLDTLLKDLPYEDRRESTYRGIVYSLCALSSGAPQAERHTYRGRSDLEVFTDKYIYIFEFKYDRSVEEAMEQIRDRDYAGRHALDQRSLYLIGVNFSTNDDNSVLAYEIQQRI
ncbi:MAG: AAA family ATPase [Bacteroides sp.]|nr:AAA family ATPase [Bacteroides sp.]